MYWCEIITHAFLCLRCIDVLCLHYIYKCKKNKAPLWMYLGIMNVYVCVLSFLKVRFVHTPHQKPICWNTPTYVCMLYYEKYSNLDQLVTLFTKAICINYLSCFIKYINIGKFYILMKYITNLFYFSNKFVPAHQIQTQYKN